MRKSKLRQTAADNLPPKKGKLSHRVGLIFHQFSSKISDELVRIEEELFLTKIDLETLKNMKQNKLYWIKM